MAVFHDSYQQCNACGLLPTCVQGGWAVALQHVGRSPPIATGSCSCAGLPGGSCPAGGGSVQPIGWVMRRGRQVFPLFVVGSSWLPMRLAAHCMMAYEEE